jgi:alginate O-acetyltransferase complex protein AlgI
MLISLRFFSFLILVAVFYWIIPKQRIRNLVLSLSSLFFISLFDKPAVVVIIALTIYSYLFASLITSQKHKAIYHKIGIIGLVLILIAFKYLGFLSNTLNKLSEFIAFLPEFHIENLLLPLGISYIIFKYISYLTDVYWGIVKKERFDDVLLYGSLFTIYVAGPIERFERFQPQISGKQPFLLNNIDFGFKRIVFGLFKKLVIANWVGYFINPYWKDFGVSPLYFQVLLLLGFSIQIYTDFAGYSDIAIGASRLFGFKILENFNWPYLQPNISKFWRNWHISLSDWIRDYLFFPLSGLSRKKTWNVFWVPLIAMGICGLWHGASLNFLIWGLWHGLGIALYQIWNQYKRKRKKLSKFTKHQYYNYFSTLVTFSYVTFGWWWFR